MSYGGKQTVSFKIKDILATSEGVKNHIERVEVKLMADLSNTDGYISLKVLWDTEDKL